MAYLSVFSIVSALLLSRTHNADTSCTPVFTRTGRDTLSPGDSVDFLCKIMNCESMSKVIYEKTDVVSFATWTPVYEGINKSHHQPLNTGNFYTLEGRVIHDTVSSYVFFEITNVTVQDNGRWRCVIIENTNTSHESMPVQLRVLPEVDVVITPAKPNLVANQTGTFRCEIDGIFPEPRFEWQTSLEKHQGGTTQSLQRDDGLWFASDIVELKFNKPGKAALKCSLTTKNGDPLIDTLVTVYIKAPATITELTKERLITKDFSTSLTLACSGSGYMPRITWQWNGLDILNDNQLFNLTTRCNASFCSSTLTLKPIELPLSCDNVVASTGEYICSVILKPPYTSKHTSKPIKVNIMYPPLIKHSTKDDDTSDSQTLRCDVCTSTNSTSKWTYNGQILEDDNIEYQYDGSVKLIGNHPSGTYTRTVRNSVGYVNCVVQYRNTDNMWKLLILLACLLLVLIVITIFITVLVKPSVKKFKDSYNRQQQGTLLRSAPVHIGLKYTFQMSAAMRSIWTAQRSDHVFLGGQDRPSITVIDDAGTQTNYYLKTGTSILHGLFLRNKTHMVNVYNHITKKYSIHCVCIDLTSKIQLISQSTLNLSAECSTPRCIFRVVNTHVGVYSYENLIVDVFDMNVLSDKKPQTLVHSAMIKLTGYQGHECDMLDTSRNGQICVLSYNTRDINLYTRSGELLTTIPCDKLDNPVHIQCFYDNRMDVVDRNGQIYSFDKKLSQSISKIGENTIVKALVFTRTTLWIIDGNDTTKIHTF